jgi:Mg-chelatase subunit ChlD
MRKLAILGLLFACVSSLAPAVSADAVVKVTQVDPSRFPEVALYVNVTDEHGQPTASLTRDDFRLVEDGKQVQIKDFAGIGEARPADIVFVFDTTGSMAGEIAGVKNTCIAFADKLHQANRDFRLGLITFGDEIRKVYGTGDVLSGNAEEFKQWISQQSAQGGGDSEEISLDGLERAFGMHYRANTQKILILITDAPPHVKGDGASFSRVEPETLTARLQNEGYTVYAVAYDNPKFRRVAEETHGEFYDLQRESDFTGIIDKIGGQIASQYRMTYLSARSSYDGTRRAIEVEVAGKKVEGTYLEKHLLNIRSSPLIAMAFLLPLVLALALPPLARRRSPSQPRPAVEMAGSERAPTPTNGAAGVQIDAQAGAQAGQQVPPAVGVPPPPSGTAAGGQTRCPTCGNILRPGAKFCGRCGGSFVVQPLVPAPPSPAYCPSCGGPFRPGAKFCGVCGHLMG